MKTRKFPFIKNFEGNIAFVRESKAKNQISKVFFN